MGCRRALVVCGVGARVERGGGGVPACLGWLAGEAAGEAVEAVWV